MKITWFRHHHENRNDLLRFGFMRLHYADQLHYKEVPFADAAKAAFSKKIMDYPDHRHLSFILVEWGRSKVRCLVDNEDSFALITPLVAEVDVCFCAGYNADFFEKKQFVDAYSWQTENDLQGYRQLIEEKIDSFGDHFHKIRRFIPIGPNLGAAAPRSRWKQKVANLVHRVNSVMGKGDDFQNMYEAFEKRQAYLNALRHEKMAYDVVLHDSLWGWPRHRVNLHKRLQTLSQKNYRIHSILNWNAPVGIDGSDLQPFAATEFPIKTNPIDQPYELMLAQSRLAVFATGFHWGWRNIMMLALQAGIPVLTDRLLTEPYFDMNEFKVFQQEDHTWGSVEALLSTISEAKWEEWKEHNQTVYDLYMSPEAVANYFITTIHQNSQNEYKPATKHRTHPA
ncbi:MAG: hypothetical protein EOO10_03220 [Chitinophagaceae bacterium]|nr:MAG: hypothetical protein EOO10_03220 [Chitinophagaceae bacterium]